MNNERGLVLVVDDNEYNRDVLSRWLERQGHKYLTAENGQEALECLKNNPVDLMLLDIMMPEMNGFQVLEHLNQESKKNNLPVIVVSAVDDLDSIVKCIDLGAEDFLFKPFNRTLLKARITACLDKKWLRDREQMYRKQIEEYNLHLEKRISEQVKEITAAQQATIIALAKLSESRDLETGKHLERVKEYCRILLQGLAQLPDYALNLNPAYIENIIAASVLHDIGKVGIPDLILLKPGRLTVEEFNIMKNHSMFGAHTLREVLREYPENIFIKVGIEMAESHHEKWDGTGYPHGQRGKEIPIAGRVLALADVYDALTTKRCYKDAISHQASVQTIYEGRGSHFDPDLVDCFIKAQDDFHEIMQRLKDTE